MHPQPRTRWPPVAKQSFEPIFSDKNPSRRPTEDHGRVPRLSTTHPISLLSTRQSLNLASLTSFRDLTTIGKKLHFRRYLRLTSLIAISLASGLFLFSSTSLKVSSIAHAPTFPPISPDAPKAPSVDASAAGFCSHTTNSCTATLTTSRSDDILVAFTVEDLDLQTSCVFSVSDSAGLSWATRSGIVFGNGGRDQIQEFWAKSAAKLSADTITETITGCASIQFGGEYNGVMVAAIGGVNFNSPFDPNISLPGSASSSGTLASVIISTSDMKDIVLGGIRFGGNVATPGAGFTTVTSMDQGQDAIEFDLVPRAATNLQVTFSGSSPNVWMEIADALHSA